MGVLRLATAVLLVGASLLGLGAWRDTPSRVSAAERGAGPRVFWSRVPLEPDTLASAWLIRRFIDPQAEIRFVPRGADPPAGIAFDVPLVDLSRTADASTFHVIRDAYGLQDPRLDRLERLMDEIEIRRWHAEPGEAARALEGCLLDLLDHADGPHAAVDAAAPLFDRLLAGDESPRVSSPPTH